MPMLLKILRIKSKSTYYRKFPRYILIAKIRGQVKSLSVRQSLLPTHAK